MCAKKWSVSDNEFIKQNISKVTVEKFSQLFGVSEKAIKVKAWRLGISGQLIQEREPFRKSWTEDDIKYLKANYGKMPIEQIADYFKLTYPAIISKASKLNLNSKLISGEIWSAREDHLLRKNFEWASKDYIMRLFPLRTWLSILQRGIKTLNLNRLTQDRHYIDHTFMDEWSEQSSYLLGIIASDGHVFFKDGEKNKTALQFEFAAKDRDILDKIKNVMKYEGPIAETSRNTVKISISNSRIVSMLLQKGIPETNKTYALKWPAALPKKYNNAFIRGVFDGDGSIYLDKSSGRIRTQFLGTKHLLEGIKRELPFDTSSNNISYRGNSEKGADIHCLSFSTEKSIELFDWMYEGASIYLERKYNKFKELMANKNLL